MPGHKRPSGCDGAPVCGVLCPSCLALFHLASLWAMVAFSFIWESLSALWLLEELRLSGALCPGMEELVFQDGVWGLGSVFKAQTPHQSQRGNGGLAPGTYQRMPLSWQLSG